MWNENVISVKEEAWMTEMLEDGEEEEDEQVFTMEELNVLTKLYEEEMAPTQEELDWMLLTEIKVER